MILASVSGACSRSGKTALAETLIRWPRGGAAAVKFTTTEDVFERCPRGTPCVVCDIEVPYRIVLDPETLGRPGTDTARLAAAGATRVVWCIARRAALAPAWSAVRRLLAAEELVVMEGSTIVPLARPDLHLFVAHPFLAPARWKATSGPLVAGADAVVVNLPARETREPSDEVMATLCAHRRGEDVRVADVSRPLGHWAPDLAASLEAMVATARGASGGVLAAPEARS